MNPESLKPIEVLLQEESRHLDDSGFTARVMAALPPPRRRIHVLRSWLLLSAIGLAVVLALLLVPWTVLESSQDDWLSSSRLSELLPFVALLIAFSWGTFSLVQEDG